MPKARRGDGWLQRAIALCAALTAAAGLLSGARADYANPNGVAVVIGNRTYAKGIPEVTFAHRDAEAFRRYVLEVLGFNPENVIDLRDATQAQMWSTFGSRASAGRSDLWAYLDPAGNSDVVVYYSGHGAPGIEDKRGYLLPVDADPNTAELNGYPIDVLYRNLSGLDEARSVTVYVDACFSGGSGGGMLIDSASPVYVSPALPETAGERLAVLTAATGKQLASWDREAKHGLFTHHLLDALHGAGDANADGAVTAREAKAYLDRHMTRAARRTFKRRQNASLVGSADTVLASAGVDGVFPARPELGASGSDSAVAVSEDDGAGEPDAVEELKSPSAEDAESDEAELELTYSQRVLVQHGLKALGFEMDAADGLFGRRTREAIMAHQRARGLSETGYLTREQFEVLMVMGEETQRRAEIKRQEAERRAEAARQADNAAFARAKETATATAYQAYLSAYPNGRHVAAAKRFGDAARQAEDNSAFSRARAQGTVESYQSYLDAYPAGRHAAEARRLRAEARPRAEAVRAAEHEACPRIVGAYRQTMREVSECGYEHAFHDYLISRTKFENHWFVEWDDSKHEMTLKNAFDNDIEQHVEDWIGWASCYLGTEHLSGSKVRVFYFGGSAGTSEPVTRLSFVEYDTDTRKFDNNAGVTISDSCDIWIGGGAESWFEESGLEILMELGEEAVRVEREEAEDKRRAAERRTEAARRADDEAFGRAKSEGTVKAYTSYIKAHPSGGHAAEARRLRDEAAERERRPVVGDRFRDCETCPEMVVVPSGSFMMGSKGPYSLRGDYHESPLHRVTIDYPFAVGVYELTRREWSWFVEDTTHSMGDGCLIVEGGKWAVNSEGGWRNPGFLFLQGDDSHPVVCVNWEDAQAYVQWLSMKTGNRYRLLSESEWEFVTRAGTRTHFWWGNEVGRNQANCAGNPGCGSDWDGKQTAPAGSFLPNAFGLHDVHGNVSEWVGDCYHEDYTGAPADGSVWRDNGDCSDRLGHRIKRGGSWVSPPVDMRSAARSSDRPKDRSYNVGFRVARTLD